MIKIIIKGRPVSYNSSPGNKTRWKARVAAAARLVCSTPLAGNDLMVKIVYFSKSAPDFDTDNISKPICDALCGIAYNDDSQLSDRKVSRRDLKKTLQLQNAIPDLVKAATDGDDFVYISVEDNPTGGTDI